MANDVGEIVWRVKSYNIQTDQFLERYVLGDDAQMALAVAYRSGVFIPHLAVTIEPVGRMLTAQMFEVGKSHG